MAAIKGKDTKPEIYLRKLLFSKGFRYRTNSSMIPGHPDIWMRKYNTAVFVHGCFWHRHSGCKYAYSPKSRIEFWEAKFEKNVLRDMQVKKQLEIHNVKCLVVWECTIKAMMKNDDLKNDCLGKIERFLSSGAKYEEM